MTEESGAALTPSKPSLMTFIKQLKQWPHKDDEDASSTALSTSPLASSPYLQPPSSINSVSLNGSRPYLPHMSHSSSAVNTMRRASPSSYNPPDLNAASGSGIFGVSLEESVKHASGSLKLGKKFDKNGNTIILGKIPVIVANCAHFLKTSNAKKVEGIFRVSGSARRIKELQAILTDPNQNYGKNLDWSPYTVHDAANLLRRYLNNLPEPIIPLEFYEKFRLPLLNYPCIADHLQGGNAISATTPPASATISPMIKDSDSTDLPSIPILPSLTTMQPDNPNIRPTSSPDNAESTTTKVVDMVQFQKESEQAVLQYKQLIDQLPILNQQVLLYILDLLYFFSQNAKENLMPAVNLASIFQPSLLSHPDHDMSPKEYHLSRAIIQFLIEHFPKLTPSIQTWINYGSSLESSVSKSSNSLAVPSPRRHSKSMSSVTIPSAIQNYIAEDPGKPVIIHPVSTLHETQSDDTFSETSIPATSAVPRRKSSSSTMSIPSTTSSTSKPSITAKGEPPLSSEISPPQKSVSAVTITPKRKPVSKSSGPTRVPVAQSTQLNGSINSASSQREQSESEFSETDTSQVDVIPPTPSSETSHKVKRKSVSSLFKRRSESPGLSLGLPFRKSDANKSASTHESMSIDSALASPSYLSSSADRHSSLSPPGNSHAFLSTDNLSNDSGSSLGANESDEERNSSGYFGKPQSSESKFPSTSISAETSDAQRRSSRWRRSLKVLNLPVLSLSDNEDASGRLRGPSADPPGDGAGRSAISQPPRSSKEESKSPSRRILRRFNQHRRSRSTVTDDGTISGAADTSDSGFSN